ncbi:MAG: tetratricopeptide repeat protein [Actinomycetia bacterium]|nr:tetratricopeptide repeat protein [Actinomycetes bacterium]
MGERRDHVPGGTFGGRRDHAAGGTSRGGREWRAHDAERRRWPDAADDSGDSREPWREPLGEFAERRGGAPSGPELPSGADWHALDPAVRTQLRQLSKLNAEWVGAHLAAAGQIIDSDPQRALAHARAARSQAGRLGVVREAVGIAAYEAGEWAEALTELRAARRISGEAHTLALIADCERALGRPEHAVRLLSDPAVPTLDADSRAELLVVVAGARRDLGQLDAALSVLARGGVDPQRPRPGSMRLWYAYADTLHALGRDEDAARWFAWSAALDPDGETDAAERAAALL